MKKFFLSIALAVVTAIGAQFVSTPAASAEDIWAGESRMGYQIYVVSESVGGQWNDFHCDVKSVYNGRLTDKKRYYYELRGSQWYLTVSYRTVPVQEGSIPYNIIEVAHQYL